MVSVLVQPGPSRPYGLIGKLAYAGGAFVREGTRTVEASLDSVMEMIRQGDPCSWEKRACGRRDLTFSEATAELETDSAGTLFAEVVRPDTGQHKAETPPSNLALLLSDQNPYGVILNTYDSAGRLTKSEKIPGSVLIQRRLVCTRLAEINRPLIDKETDDFVRRETFPWPPQALSAAVTLMLMHRDYASPLASAVCIHTDTIRFLTPGGIPADLALGQKLLESSRVLPQRRIVPALSRPPPYRAKRGGFGRHPALLRRPHTAASVSSRRPFAADRAAGRARRSNGSGGRHHPFSRRKSRRTESLGN